MKKCPECKEIVGNIKWHFGRRKCRRCAGNDIYWEGKFKEIKTNNKCNECKKKATRYLLRYGEIVFFCTNHYIDMKQRLGIMR